MTEAKSIIGRKDNTLFLIVDALIKAKESTIHGDKRFIQTVRHFLMHQDSKKGQTPLHYAFKNGNIELVLCIFTYIK